MNLDICSIFFNIAMDCAIIATLLNYACLPIHLKP